MPVTTITLSDGGTLDVRTLGISELDDLAPEPVEKFAYKMELVTGQTAYVEFPIERYTEPPVKPDMDESEIKPKTREWSKLKEWQIYQAALQRERERAEASSRYLDDVFTYILRRCIDPEQAYRIVTDEDWDAVYWVALVPQLTQDLLVKVLRSTYKATYKDEDIFVALQKASGGNGVYDAMRVWENQLMIQMGMTEDQYVTLSLDERARKVCAMKIDAWLGYLEMEESRKKAEAEALAAKGRK